MAEPIYFVGSAEEDAQLIRDDSWREGVGIVCRTFMTQEAFEESVSLTYQTVIEPDAETGLMRPRTKYLWHNEARATVAVLAIRCEGYPEFEDPDSCKRDEDGKPIRGTGQVIALDPHDAEQRMRQMRKVDYRVIQAVHGKLQQVAARPLGPILENATPTKSDSVPGSTRKSKASRKTSSTISEVVPTDR